MKDKNLYKFNKVIIQINLVYDLLFNLLLTRLLNNLLSCLKGEAVELSDNNVKSSLDKYQELYNY